MFVIIASYGHVSMRGVRLDWRRPFEIWQVGNERQQPLVGDIQRSELRGLSLLMWLVLGSLSVFALPFTGLKRFLPLLLTISSWLAYDHDSLSRCTDVIFQG